jgi:hypothetical protein
VNSHVHRSLPSIYQPNEYSSLCHEIRPVAATGREDGATDGHGCTRMHTDSAAFLLSHCGGAR